MQVQLSGQQIEVTQAMRDHVNAKIDRVTRLDDKITNLSVVLSVNKLQQRAEANLAIAGATLHAESVNGDLYASIDHLFDKLSAQLRKHREKICDKRHRVAHAHALEERQYG